MSDVIIGAKLEADASGAINSVKNFKQELRLAQQEVVTLSEKFGATSKEAAAAAMRAAELKDKIGDAASLVDAFNPDTKFRAFGASIQTVVGGFTALTGAMGLLGVESEEVQKTLLKVQSALALSQGIAQLQEGMQAMKNLGAVLVNTLGKSGLMGIAIAGVAALGLALSGVFKRNQELIKSNAEYTKGLATARVEVSKLQNSMDLARKGVISKDDALKQYNATLGQVTGEVSSLDAAETLMQQNAGTYVQIQALKAKANYLLQKSAEAAGDAELFRLAAEKGDMRGALSQGAAQAQAAADRLDGVVQSINNQIATLMGTIKKSIGGNIGAAGKGSGAKTPGGQAAKAETEEAKLIYSKAEDDRLQRQIDFQNNSLASRKIFLDAQAAMDQEALTAEQEEFYKAVQAYEDLRQAEADIDRASFESKMAFATASADILGGLSELLGRQTAAGKVLAVAEATINTYAAIAGQLKAFAGVPIPGYAIAQAIATGIFGLVQVKKILAVPVPGSSSGGGGGSVSSPLTPRVPQSTGTRLDRDQLNQIGNAAVRAFVVESDISTSQSRIRRLNRAARI